MQLPGSTTIGYRPLLVVAALVRDADSGLARAGARNAALAVVAERERRLALEAEDAAAARLPGPRARPVGA